MPHDNSPALPQLFLRDYQFSSLHDLRAALHAGEKRLILYSPTGSGKTEIAMAMIEGAQAKKKRVGFLCNRIELVSQSSRRFAKSHIAHGVIQGQNTMRTYEPVQVCSIQTVARRGLPEVDLLIIDEAHAVPGTKAFRDILLQATCPVIGLTATPFSRGMGKHYDELDGPLFERIVIAATIPELIEQGYLVDCDIYAPGEPDMTGVRQSRNAFGEMDYADNDVARAVDQPQLIGDIVEHWMRLAKDLPTVCFAANIAHSQHIVEQFNKAGVKAEHIDCYTDDKDRLAVLARVERGETTIISNVGILAEGWDFPACRAMILARPTRSLTRYIQMAGRVLRPYPGKDKALILDHSGTAIRLGFPTDDLPLTLDEGRPRETSATQDEEREPALPTVCPSCQFLKPTGVHVCPQCGFAPTRRSQVEVAEGQLVKLRKKATKMDKQAFYSQLIHIAQAKGYKDGWVAWTYRKYFDVWPKGLERVAQPPTAAVHDFIRHLRIKQAHSHDQGATS